LGICPVKGAKNEAKDRLVRLVSGGGARVFCRATVVFSIQDLEDEIGAALFIRHHGGVQLTQAGQRFLVRARRALNQIGRAALDAQSIGRGESAIVRIGIFSSIAPGPPSAMSTLGGARGGHRKEPSYSLHGFQLEPA